MLGTNLKKPAKAREIILATVAMLTSIYFALTNFVQPKAQEAVDLTGQLHELQEKTTSLQKLNDVLREKKRQAEAEAAKQKRPEEEPSEPDLDPRVQLIKHNKKQRYVDVSEFLQDVSSRGFRSSVVIDSVKYDPKQMRNGYAETRFNFIIHGDYVKILSFIKKLEGVPALVSIENVNMNVSAGETQNVAVSLVGVFYQLEEDNV
jgi:Tfp pilus assembly protein PilO